MRILLIEAIEKALETQRELKITYPGTQETGLSHNEHIKIMKAILDDFPLTKEDEYIKWEVQQYFIREYNL